MQIWHSGCFLRGGRTMMSAGGGGGKPGARAGSRGGSPGPSGPPGNGAGGQRLPRRCPGPAGLSRPAPASAGEGHTPPPPPTPGFPQGRGRGLTFPELHTAIKADVPSARPLPSPRAGCTQGARFSGAAFLACEATILSFHVAVPAPHHSQARGSLCTRDESLLSGPCVPHRRGPCPS